MRKIALPVLVTMFSAGIVRAQDHFVPVWTGNGLDHMNFYITSATIDGTGLQAGDEIAVFDSIYCVGMVRLTGPVTTYAEIRASRDEEEPGINGYTEGNAVSFSIWDSSGAVEYTDVEAAYTAGTGVFELSGTASLSLSQVNNQAPVADAGADQDVDEGTPVTLDGSASFDPDGDSLAYTWTAPAAITLSDNASKQPTFTAPEVTADTVLMFLLVVDDGSLVSDPDTTRVTVRQVNKLPVITGQNPLDTDEDTDLTLLLEDFTVADPDNDTSEMTLMVLDGTLYSRMGNTVTPDADYSGTLTVPVQVSDGTDNSAVFNASVAVNAINDAPWITGQNAVSSMEDQAFDVLISHLVITDPDNVPADMSLTVLDSVNYSVSGNTVTPDPDFSGTLVIPVSVSDTSMTSNTFLLTATVNPLNDPPVITGQQVISSSEDAPFDILAADLLIDDPDNDSADFIVLISDSTHYSFSESTVVPDPDFSGTLYIPLRVSDGSDLSNRFVATAGISSVNDAPVIKGQSVIKTVEDSSFMITTGQLTITDPDNVPADFSIVISDSLHYSVSGNRVTPDAGYSGTLHVPVTVSDGQLSSNRFITVVEVLPKLAVQVSKSNVSTYGGHDGSIDLTVTGGTPNYLYDWNTGAFTQDIFFLYPGIYTVTVTDAGIQSVTLTIEIFQPELQTCDISIEITWSIDSITQEVSFTPSTSQYQLFWSFGDGTVSNLPSPTHQYGRPGLYRVCVNAYDSVSDCSYETCTMVEVGSPECVADFGYYVDQGDDLLVHFTDNSYGAVGSWYWNFADGSVSTDQDVDHRFTEAGTYKVCLFTFDEATACLAEACKEISVGSVELVADFSYFVNPLTLKASFTNNSYGEITDYYWTYGDGNVYSGKDSSHLYKDPGIYQVCLSIRNRSTGKFTETCKEIKVGTLPCDVNASFTYFIDPRARKVNFTDISSGTVHSYFWNFGDGSSSSTPDPVHYFSKAGYYLVSLSVRDTLRNCNDYRAELIQVGQADCKSLFNHSVDPVTMTVTLEDKSLGNIKDYYWTFDDGYTSTESDPSHQYAGPGLYEISLTVTDVTGTCMDHSSRTVQVGYVDCSADFNVFIDSSTNEAWFSSLSVGRLIRYYWIFGDGKMSTEKDPVHIFSVPGYHKVSLNTFNELSGCMDYHEKIILIGSQGSDCEADFIYQTDESTNTVSFSDKSLGEGLTWYWNFGDGSYSLLQNPRHQYPGGGVYNICLTVYSATGIQNTTCKQIFTGAPAAGDCFAKFMYTVNDPQLKVNYSDKSFGSPDTWTWKFGDGQTSGEQNPAHIFAEAGYYTSHQRIKNSSTGCVSDAFALVSVGMEGGLIAGFGYTYDSTITTKAESYPVDYVGVSLGDASKYKWSFGDGNYDSTTTTPTHIYTYAGTYEVCLTVYDEVAGTENTSCDSVTVPYVTSIRYLHDETEIMLHCYPNPAGESYYLTFTMQDKGDTRIELYSLTGSKIRTEINRRLEAGSHRFELSSKDLANGLYLIKLSVNKKIVMQIISIQHK